MGNEPIISYDFVNDKLQQINEAKKAFNLLVIEYGKQNRKFQDGDIVKLLRNGRKYTIRRADFAMNNFQDKFKLVVQYMIEPMAKGTKINLKVLESEIEKV